jgi:hypothetical protein
MRGYLLDINDYILQPIFQRILQETKAEDFQEEQDTKTFNGNFELTVEIYRLYSKRFLQNNFGIRFPKGIRYNETIPIITIAK